MIKDHVIESNSEGQRVSRPVLSVQSLWRQACMRLLDIDTDAALLAPSSTSPSSSASISSTSSSSSSSSPSSSSPLYSSSISSPTPTPPSILPLEVKSVTWDQKYFSQIELTDSGRVAIQDMMLNILRISVRCLLSRDDVETIDVAVRG